MPLSTDIHHLPNGLTVLTREVHTAPIATCWIWYKVGGRNERVGISGISHWCEHMLFKGTPTMPKGAFDATIARNGGTFNGFTWIDYTAYYETLPADRLDLGMAIEADRMVNSMFDPAEVASERTVIISEREGNENSPTFWLDEELRSTAFKVHPYRNGVIGWKSDLRAMTREDLYTHYKTYYAPNNAVLVYGNVDQLDSARSAEFVRGAIPLSADLKRDLSLSFLNTRPGTLKVFFFNPGNPDAVTRAMSDAGAMVLRSAKAQPDGVFYTADVLATSDRIGALMALPHVVNVGFEGTPQLDDEQSNQIMTNSFTSPGVPALGYRNFLQNILGGLNGAGVTMAVVDTGADRDHPDLAAAYIGGWPNTNCTGQSGPGDDVGGHGAEADRDQRLRRRGRTGIDRNGSGGHTGIERCGVRNRGRLIQSLVAELRQHRLQTVTRRERHGLGARERFPRFRVQRAVDRDLHLRSAVCIERERRRHGSKEITAECDAAVGRRDVVEGDLREDRGGEIAGRVSERGLDAFHSL